MLFVRFHNTLNLCRRFAPLAFLAVAVTAAAQTDIFPTPAAAIATLFPNKKFVEWESIDGDWNGDGIKDLAMVLRQMDGPVDEPEQIRVVVLAGVFGGRYSPLAVSSSYCIAQRFYGLEAKGSSLFVTAVHKADGNNQVTDTLQFRFNKKLDDLELIGKDNIYESLGNEHGRISINYLAGTAIVYERVRGRIKVKTKSRFEVPQLERLNGFDCDKYFYSRPN